MNSRICLLVAMAWSSWTFAAGVLPETQGARQAKASEPLVVAQAAGASKAGSQAATAEMDALVKAAKGEGEVIFYSVMPENVSRKVVEEFRKKYGINAAFIRQPSVALEKRYSTEAEAGAIAADLFVDSAGSSIRFAQDAIKKGWMTTIAQAGIPAMKSGEFPQRFVTGPTAIIQINPRLIAYNTEKVRGADVPKDWPDILKPKFKGQILLADPRSSDLYAEFFGFILEKYGESFFTSLRELNPRYYDSGIPAMQGLAAGEGAFMFPAISPSVQALTDKGAPLGMFTPSFTIGVESHLIMTARSKQKHPNAAILLANYLMSKEGNMAMNSDVGNISVYDTSGLPKNYQSPKLDAVARKDQLNKLLGYYDDDGQRESGWRGP